MKLGKTVMLLFFVSLLSTHGLGTSIKEKDLRVPHIHQVYGVRDWTGGRTFVSPTTGKKESILYASCWPTALTDVLLFYRAVKHDPKSTATAVKKAYDAFADFEDGAHTDLIPGYIRQHYPNFYARKFKVESLRTWPSSTKWEIVKGAIDRGWPVIASVSWVKTRGKIFPHAFVIRGYREGRVNVAIVNDPAGSFTMTGQWDKKVTGEKLSYVYDDFFDRYFIVVVPAKDKAKLDAFLGQFHPQGPASAGPLSVLRVQTLNLK